MKSRIYTVNETKMKFNSKNFKIIFETYCKTNKLKMKDVEKNIAEKVSVSTETVHKWHYGKSSPSDLECVKDLATSININDYQMLLENIDGVNNKLKLNERQVTAVKKIYDICIWFLTEFECTDGFNDYWYTLKKEGIVNDKNDVIEFVDKMHGKIGLILDQEYFDLRDTDIYNELCEFVCDDLVDIYDGKLSCGYRYEAFEYEKDTTSDDYNKAMIKLNGIIEKYV